MKINQHSSFTAECRIIETKQKRYLSDQLNQTSTIIIRDQKKRLVAILEEANWA
jgi:hypothetical protein